jgi:hypothetical protein
VLLICTSLGHLRNIFHDVLLTTLAGSVDKIVKFWDLHTFALISSSRPKVLYLFVSTRKKSFMSSIEATVCPNSESIYILNPKLYSDTEKAIFGEGYNFNKLYLTTR